jgi:hypothetical protein
MRRADHAQSVHTWSERCLEESGDPYSRWRRSSSAWPGEHPVIGEGTVRELAKLPEMRVLEDIHPDSKTLLLSRGVLDTAPLFPARLPATTFGDLNFLAVSRDGSRFYVPQAVEQRESDLHVRLPAL